MKFSSIKLSKKQIPNLITTIRIGLGFLSILFYLLAFLDKSSVYTYSFISIVVTFRISALFLVAAIVFIIGAISDWVDGYLARKWNVVSNYGKILDPIADKILVNGVFIALASYGIIPSWIVILFVVRDIIVDSIRMYCLHYQILVAARNFGKWKTVMQMVAIVILSLVFNQSITSYTTEQYWFYYLVQNGFSLIALLLSYLALIDYCWLFYQQQKQMRLKIEK
ncbi:CDP-diacylglycerol-glycerol-3-phosphate 3-phosphatidyltransferase [[Mycoplasma] cavipharyngis]|uniref:CDP-diacylglycerol--glycerol-3-phosphate 3-phosphatidyltransferase n=1 Tax=[Mycoplasma] cavipharyngis TaxID=92757 RepID=UPI003704C386